MPAWPRRRDTGFGLKAVGVFPDNPRVGLDAHQGIVTLFDGETGVPTAILERLGDHGDPHRRGHGAGHPAARARGRAACWRCSAPACRRRRTCEALALVREFEEVRVFSPNAAHAGALVARPAGRARRGVRVHRRGQRARGRCEGADVVVTATSSREPVLEREWLAEGAT